MKNFLAVSAFALMLNVPPTHAESSTPAYHQLASIPLEGNDRWDYLTFDADAHRLYITRATHVQVMDTATDNIVGDIPGTKGVHGVAVAAKLGKGFISDGLDNAVTVFDLKTLEVTGTIAVGQKPDAILYEPVTGRVFAFNGTSSDASVIDAASNKVLDTITLGGKPEFAVADGKGMIYDNLEDTSEMLAIDAEAMKVAARWKLAPCEAPSGLAIDPAHRRLFAVCDNEKMVVVDAGSGKVVAAPAIGKGPDAAAYDPAMGLVFSPNGEDGTMTILHQDGPDAYSPVATLETQTGARTMALDPANHKLYTITAKFGPKEDVNGRQRPSIVPGSVTLLVYGNRGE